METELPELEEVFLAALEHSAETRADFLRSRCADNKTLADEVSSMLRAHEEAQSFLEAPAFETNAFLLAEELPTLRAGQLVANYQILSLIGRGGMGEVYLADDIELNRQVAIKLIRRHAASLVQHLRREARILAALNHPGIALLYGAAVTSEGVPYFVMEYVEGERLDDYCRQRQLTLRDRLALFQKVCAAVTYAHHHLVIHRDLKPANIRVTNDGEPKLLDFGIARVLDSDSTTRSEQTQLLRAAMTREYASPEQLAGGSMTTASDVYSLGVILFELLTGHRYPRTQATATLPSRVAANFQSELKGDLDSIVGKALRDEPQHRYTSVAQLADDLRRYRDGLPVIARKGSKSHRAAKFARRHRLAIAAVGLILTAIIAGTITTAWEARVARRAQSQAEAVSSFLEQMISYSNPYLHSAGNSDGVSMNQVLAAAAERLQSGEFDEQPEVKAELERAIADSYFRQGLDKSGNEHYDKYIALAAKTANGDKLKALNLAIAQASRHFGKGELKKSETIFRQILPQLRREHTLHRVTGDVLVNADNEFGYLRRTQGDSHDAELAFREALSLANELPKDSQYVIAITRSTLASTLADEGKFAEALWTAQQAVDDSQHLGLADSPASGFSLTILGGFLTDNDNLADARAALSKGESIFTRSLQPSHLWLGDNLRNQAILAYKQSRFADALADADKALRIYKEGFGPHYDQYPTALIVKGLTLARTDQVEQGEAILREALKLRTESLPPQHSWVAQAKGALGECLARQARFSEAEPLLTSSYQTLKLNFGAEDPRTKEAGSRLKLVTANP